MRILVASGIFEPESGGPATYAPALAARLAARGHAVAALTYSDQKSYAADSAYPFKLTRIVRSGKIVSRLKYLAAALRLVRDADIIYSLDWFAAGLPVALAALVFHKPYVLRIGGDYLWEQRYLESGEEPCTLAGFYKRGLHKRISYWIPLRIISFVFSHAAGIAFNSHAQRALYERYYRISPDRTTTIENPVPVFERIARATPTHEFVYWGRLIVMKNIETLIRAFGKARIPAQFVLTIIGDGPQKKRLETLVRDLGLSARIRFEPGMPHTQALERVKNARAFILPSWTDIAPNQVAEAIAIGIPALVTKENYLGFNLPETFDPHSVAELAHRIEMLADESRYQDFARLFAAHSISRDWNAVVDEHLKFFERVAGAGAFRVLQIGADRSRQGILYPHSSAAARQRAYAQKFGHLDIIGFSRRSETAHAYHEANLHVYPTRSRSPLLYGFDAWRIARTLPRPSVVSVQDPFETGLIGLLIAWRFGVPLHVQVHTDFLSPGYARLSVVNWIRTLIAGFVVRRAKRIRVVSERVRQGLVERYSISVPITVLPIFVDIGKFKNAEPIAWDKSFADYAYKLLVVARDTPEKNIDLAVRAFRAVAPKDACLLVTSERDQIHQLSKEDPRIRTISTFDPSRYYKSVDLVLVPSKYEGYGLVIIEALAAGKPVLATDVGVARESGAIISNEKDFAQDLKRWFENGPRTGILAGYPYRDFDEYVAAYCDDIVACTKAG